ncbi:MAG: sigma-54 interaction domain-containing protein [Candidatus Sumerlaeia bacterium]
MAKQSKKSLPTNPTEAILESISDGVFTVDENWRVMSFNRAAEEITGIPRSEAIGRLCSEVFRSSMCETDCALRQTLHSEKPVINRTCYIIDAEGNRIPISVSTAVLRNEAGELIGGAETFRDLSEVEALRQELEGRAHMGELVSHNPQMQRLFEMAHTVADSDSTVLIEGETGTGKELLARGIHDLGPRSKEPFLALNCGALPDNLLESELFGYKKGAFTGAEKDKPGRFALAGKGTLFLDEIGEVSPAMQVRLLRVLQENVYEPLGSIRSEKTQARIIAATNRDLENMVQQGTFRQDLYYRINIVRMQLPPLRRRKEDIPLLARHFIERFNRLQNRKVQDLSPDAMSLLMAHDWPGNVRELENVIERAFVVCREGLIEIKHLPESMRGPEIAREGGANIESVRRIAERQSILNALERNDFNRQAAARDLGIHKATLYRKIKNLGIDLP